MEVINGVGVFVLSHPSKKCTTTEVLKNMCIPHTIYTNADWDLPWNHAEWNTDRSWRPSQRDYAIRQYRAIRGHQEILKLSEYDITMVMEDDITHMPESFFWEAVVVAGALLGREQDYDGPDGVVGAEAVSFHGRNLSNYIYRDTLAKRQYVELLPRIVHEKAQQEFLRPLWDTTDTVATPLELKWHEGCLMYAVNKDGRYTWINDTLLSGWPCDLFLVNNLKTMVLLDSPVVHGTTSLMTERV